MLPELHAVQCYELFLEDFSTMIVQRMRRHGASASKCGGTGPSNPHKLQNIRIDDLAGWRQEHLIYSGAA